MLQRSVLGPVLHLLYTCDLPTQENNTTANFTDDTDHEEAPNNLQISMNHIIT